MGRVGLHTPDTNTVSARTSRVEDCKIIGTKDQSVAGCKRKILGQSSGLINVVTVKSGMSLVLLKWCTRLTLDRA